MVGRSSALERPRSVWRLATSGRHQTVWIGGEAGVGKTMLIERFMAEVGEMHCAHGQCVEQYGTGALVEAVAGRTGASTIVGIDPSQPFIAYARQRFPDPRFSFDCGDGMALPYPDTSFDCALSLLVFQFIPQPIRAANEMRRVTHPGRTVGACAWDSGGGGLEMARIFWDEAVKLDGTAANEIPERSLHCNRAGELTKVWRAAGLEGVEELALEIQTDFSDFDDYWVPYSSGVGPQGVYNDRLSAPQRQALRDALRERLLGDGPDRPFSLRARAFAVRGTVPRR